MTKQYETIISQREVRILAKEDWPKGYEDNRPNDKWELVEYEYDNGEIGRFWTPAYTLQYGKFNDHSKLKIIDQVKEE